MITAAMSDTATAGVPQRPPTLDEIRDARQRLGSRIRETPVWQWQSLGLEGRLGMDTEVFLKLELFQHAGTFKPRGALINMLALDSEALERGVTAVSAGNHAMAVAFAARSLGTTAKVVMPKTANAARVAGSRAYGAEVVLVDDVHRAFDEVHRIEREEGRTFVHPFEGYRTALGTATLGLELARQVPELDAVIVPVGGGGLAAGVATAIKLAQPHARLLAVEPEGADTMRRSLEAGKPESIDRVDTIADSLGAPHAAPYTFSLCQRYLDDLQLITDDQIRQSMELLFTDAKLAVEPAGAATTAALLGPYREELRGRRVGLIVCGANLDVAGFVGYLGL